MQHEFVESRHRIIFDRSYQVIAFDRTEWFSRLTGFGFKGVDFMALKDGKLYLIEMKNYKQAAGFPEPLLPIWDRFIQSMGEKYTDSLRIIHIVVETLRRHFLFRVWWWLAHRIQWIKNAEPQWAFWMDAKSAKESERVTKVLWIIHPDFPGILSFPDHWMVLTGSGPFVDLKGVFALEQE
jgi:hypothetical protein